MASKRKTPRRGVRKAATNKQRGRARRAVLAKRKRPAKPTAGLRSLYPAIQPYNSGMLRVSPVHEIYYEECGNPNGKPAVFVHGGPGAGCDNRARRFFDRKAHVEADHVAIELREHEARAELGHEPEGGLDVCRAGGAALDRALEPVEQAPGGRRVVELGAESGGLRRLVEELPQPPALAQSGHV